MKIQKIKSSFGMVVIQSFGYMIDLIATIEVSPNLANKIFCILYSVFYIRHEKKTKCFGFIDSQIGFAEHTFFYLNV